METQTPPPSTLPPPPDLTATSGWLIVFREGRDEVVGSLVAGILVGFAACLWLSIPVGIALPPSALAWCFLGGAALILTVSLSAAARNAKRRKQQASVEAWGKEWDKADPLGRLMCPYVTECTLTGRVVRVFIKVVNAHPYPKTLRIPDGTVEFFRRTASGGAVRLAQIDFSSPTVSIPGNSVNYEVPQWDPRAVSDNEAKTIAAARQNGSLEVLVSINCAVVSNQGAESVSRFGFMPFLRLEQKYLCKDCGEEARGEGDDENPYCINHLRLHTKSKEVVVK
jgi:hypothetical protein